MVIRRRSLLLAGVALPVAARAQCVTDRAAVDACWGGVRITAPPPSFDLSFMTPGTLDPGITFTRASTATYFDATGTLQTAAANSPRWDYNPATRTLKGLLVEEARTNLFLQSGDASNAAWSTGSTGGPVAPTVNGNQTTAPDGTTTAARVVYPAVSVAASYSLLYQGIPVAALAYTFSVWLKGNVGGEQLYLSVLGGSGTSPRLTLTTQWQRFSLVTNTLTAATWFFAIGTDLRDGAQASTPAQTVFVWGAQLEAGVFPTSYIPTTAAAATRAIDSATMPTSPWLTNPLALSAVVDGMLPAAGVNANWFQIDDGTNNNRMQFLTPLGGNTVQYFEVVAASTTMNGSMPNNPFVLGVPFKAGFSTVSALHQITYNGLPPTATFAVANPPSVTTLRLGRSIAATTSSFYLRRFRYWPRALSGAELQATTT